MEQKQYDTLPSETLLLKYLSKTMKVEREQLKKEIQSLCTKLIQRDVLVSIDFKEYGNTLYSEKLNQDIWYCQSSGILIQTEGSIIYRITERGLEKANDMKSAYYENVSQRAIKILDELLADVPQRFPKRPEIVAQN